MQSRMKCAHELARNNFEVAQGKMKVQYDKRSKMREFKEGDLVLLYDNTVCKPLQARYRGPYLVLRKLGPVNCLLFTPDRRQATRNLHVNLMKGYEGDGSAENTLSNNHSSTNNIDCEAPHTLSSNTLPSQQTLKPQNKLQTTTHTSAS